MLKIKTDDKHIEIEVCGNLPQICSELAQTINGIKDRLAESDPKVGHEFKVIFTKGFMDGVVFQEDREHMEHYLAEGDKKIKFAREARNEAVDMLNDLIDFLKGKSAEMKKAKNDLDKMIAEENDDEAE